MSTHNLRSPELGQFTKGEKRELCQKEKMMEIAIAIMAVLILMFLILMFPIEKVYGRQTRRKIKCLAGAALEKKR